MCPWWCEWCTCVPGGVSGVHVVVCTLQSSFFLPHSLLPPQDIFPARRETEAGLCECVSVGGGVCVVCVVCVSVCTFYSVVGKCASVFSLLKLLEVKNAPPVYKIVFYSHCF